MTQKSNQNEQVRPPKSQHFRAGTGAVILNPDLDRVLLFKRNGSVDDWQFPQGGLDIGEEPLDGVMREIWEETGITKGALQQLPVKPKLLAYEIPAEHRTDKTGRGQTQWWFFFQFVGEHSAITLGDQEEFSDFQWTTMDDAVERIVGFKREVYEGLWAHLVERGYHL